MSDYAAMARDLKETLGLKHEPVAITLIKKGRCPVHPIIQ